MCARSALIVSLVCGYYSDHHDGTEDEVVDSKPPACPGQEAKEKGPLVEAEEGAEDDGGDLWVGSNDPTTQHWGSPYSKQPKPPNCAEYRNHDDRQDDREKTELGSVAVSPHYRKRRQCLENAHE